MEDLGVPFFLRRCGSSISDIVECHFVFAPSVREDCIWRDGRFIREFLELMRSSIEEAHFESRAARKLFSRAKTLYLTF
jgi:hypothetical protein